MTPDRPRSLLTSRARGLSVLAIGALATILLAACSGAAATVAPAATAAPSPSDVGSASPGPSASPVTFPLTLVDDEGNTIKLATRPSRIVSLTPATTETLFALGAGERVVADTDFDDYPPQVKQLPHVATYSSVDVEKIVSLRPDLVVAGGNGFNSPDALAKLRELGIPVLVVYAKDVAGVLSDIRLVGAAAGEGEAATAMTTDMRAGIDAVAASVASLDHPRTFYEIDATKDIYGPADDSFVAEMVKLAGGEPITTGSTTQFSIPLEKLVAADPQVIVLGDANYGTTVKDVVGRPGWDRMAAVKDGAIRPVNDTVVTRPGPRLVEGLRDLALAIHPDASLPPGPPATPSSDTSASAAP